MVGNGRSRAAGWRSLALAPASSARAARGPGSRAGLQGTHYAPLVSSRQPLLVSQRPARRGVAGEFIVVDAEHGSRRPAFDHQKLAAGLSKAAGGEAYTAAKLPFGSIEFDSNGKSIRFDVAKVSWTCSLETYECVKAKADESSAKGPAAGNGQPSTKNARPRGRRNGEGEGEDSGRPGTSWVRSPDGLWEASVKAHNVTIRREGKPDEIRLSTDGKEGLAYGRLSWAPDSKTLVAFRVEPGDAKEVFLIQSSPPGGGRARMQKRPYSLPGDKFTAYELNLFDVTSHKQTRPAVERIDLGSPRLRWNKDGHHFTFEKNDRGHQRFRLVEVDTHTGAVRNIIDEKSQTFIWTAHAESVRLRMINWLENSDEIIYVTEPRRLAPSLLDRRQNRRGQEPDHARIVCGARDRSDR